MERLAQTLVLLYHFHHKPTINTNISMTQPPLT